MAIDTSAFDNVKKTRSGRDSTRIDISAFGLEWATPKPSEDVQKFTEIERVGYKKGEKIVQQPDSSRFRFKPLERDSFFSPSAEGYGIRDVAREIPGSLGQLGKDIGQSIMRNIASFVGSEALEPMVKPITDAVSKVEKNSPFFRKFTDDLAFRLYGDLSSETTELTGETPREQILPIGERTLKLEEKLDKKGQEYLELSKTPGLNQREKLIAESLGSVLTEQKGSLAPILIGGFVGLDLVPIPGGQGGKMLSKTTKETIAKSTDVKIISAELKKELPETVTDEQIDILAQLLKDKKTVEDIDKSLEYIRFSEPKPREFLQDAETKKPITQSQMAERMTARNTDITPPTRTVDNIPPQLATEARKYKSAEEFVNDYRGEIGRLRAEEAVSKAYETGKTQYIKAYRGYGTNYTTEIGAINRAEDVLKNKRLLTDGGDDIYITTDYDEALRYANGKPDNVLEFEAPVYKGVKIDGEQGNIFYPTDVTNGVDIRNVKVATPDSEMSQLTDIWNKANPSVSARISPPETTINVDNKDIPINTRAPEEKVRVPEDELERIRDVARRDQTTLRPIRAVGKKDGRNLAKEVEANILKYNEKLPDKDIARIREENLLGPESIDDIILRKRGIITDAEAIERAKRIQGTLQDVINLPKGTAVTKEQRIAIEQIVADERNINKAIRTLIDNGGASSTQSERDLIKRLGEGNEKLSEHEILVQALEESTLNLKRAEIVLMGVTSEAGRTLQSANKVAEAVDTRLRILWNKINKNKKLDTLEKQALVETVIKLDTKDNKTFLKTLEDLNEADFFDKVAEWSVAAKLWNPTTHAINLGGNALRNIADMAIKGVTNPMVAKADVHGAIVGFKRGMKNALRALTDDGYAAQLSKYIETGGTAPAIKGRLGKYVRTPFRMLGAGDEIFKNIAYQRKLHRDAYTTARKEGLKGPQRDRRMEELLNTPTFKMMEDATEEAKRMTFQEDMGEIMTRINRLRDPQAYSSKFGKGAAVGIRFFLPFLKTPTNLFKQTVDMSPLGLVKNWDALKKAAKEGNTEKVGTILGEAMFGSAIALYITMETLDGNITGGAPRDPAKKDRFYRENKLPYAIKIGDTWYQYKRVDPFASIMGLTADLVTTEEKTAGSLFGIVAENLKDKTYLSGVSDLMKVLTGEEWERDYALKSMILGATMPSFVGHITRSMDPNVRVADTIGQRLLVQVPGMSDDFPSRVNVLGYDVQRANKGLNYFFNPVQMESARIDPVTRQLMEIDKTISVPQDNFQRDGVTYKLTESEYEDFARYVGIKLRFDLVKLFDSGKYKRSDIDEKNALIDTLRREIQDEWKEEYIKSKGTGLSKAQQIRNVFAGKPIDAEPDTGLNERVRNYFLGQ